MTAFRAALAFFTRLPVHSASANFSGMLAWLPVIGLILGLLLTLFAALSAFFFPKLLCGPLICLAWVAVTGGLHLDGAADCGDGMIFEAPPKRRLEVMQDSRLGTFGALVLFLLLLVKASALTVLCENFLPTWEAFFRLAGAICLATVLSRCMVFVAVFLPSARPEGLGSALSQSLSKRQKLLPLLFALILSVLNGKMGLVSLLVALGVTWFLLSAAKKRLGGVTGDVFGCLVESVECAVLCACCAIENAPPSPVIWTL